MIIQNHSICSFYFISGNEKTLKCILSMGIDFIHNKDFLMRFEDEYLNMKVFEAK